MPSAQGLTRQRHCRSSHSQWHSLPGQRTWIDSCFLSPSLELSRGRSRHIRCIRSSGLRALADFGCFPDVVSLWNPISVSLRCELQDWPGSSTEILRHLSQKLAGKRHCISQRTLSGICILRRSEESQRHQIASCLRSPANLKHALKYVLFRKP